MADVATYVIRLKFVASMDTAGLRAADATVNKMTRDLEALNTALRKINGTPDPGGFKAMGNSAATAHQQVRVLRYELSHLRATKARVDLVQGPVQPGQQRDQSILGMLGRTAMQSVMHQTVSTAMNAVGDTARFMFNANVEMDEAIGNLAAMSFISGNANIEDAKSSATEKAKTLARLAAEGTGDLTDYLEANQAIYLAARTAGASDEQINRLIRGAVVSGTVMRPQGGGARSAAMDVQQALSGGIGDKVTPLLNLALRGAGLPAEAEDFNKLSMEKRLEHILTALERFNEAEVLAKSKFTTQVDILRENLAEMSRSLTGDMFQDLVDGLTTLNDVFAALRPYINFFLERMDPLMASGLLFGPNGSGTAALAGATFESWKLAGREVARQMGPEAPPSDAAPSGGDFMLPGGGTVFAGGFGASMLLYMARKQEAQRQAEAGAQFNMVADADLRNFMATRNPMLGPSPDPMMEWWRNPMYEGAIPFYKMGTGSDWLDFYHKLNEPGYGADRPELDSFFGYGDERKGRGRSSTTIKVEWGDRSLATALTNVVRDAGSRQMDASLSSRDSGEVF